MSIQIASQQRSRHLRGIVAASATVLALLLASCTGKPSLEGKYQDPNGATIEFIKGGTAIFAGSGKQYEFSWELLGDGRFKLTPWSDVTFLGSSAPQICNYRFNDNGTLYLSGCPLTRNVTLSRI